MRPRRGGGAGLGGGGRGRARAGWGGAARRASVTTASSTSPLIGLKAIALNFMVNVACPLPSNNRPSPIESILVILMM